MQAPIPITFRPADEDAKNFRPHWSVQFWKEFPAKKEKIMFDNGSGSQGYEASSIYQRYFPTALDWVHKQGICIKTACVSALGLSNTRTCILASAIDKFSSI